MRRSPALLAPGLLLLALAGVAAAAPSGRARGPRSDVARRYIASPVRRMTVAEAEALRSAIARRVQPCAERQRSPGAGAEAIRVTLQLSLNRDGSLAAPPQIVASDGVDEGNRRYLARVEALATDAFTACTPIAGLPPALYDVRAGWRVIRLRFKLTG